MPTLGIDTAHAKNVQIHVGSNAGHVELGRQQCKLQDESRGCRCSNGQQRLR
jgi:hypothetical protein